MKSSVAIQELEETYGKELTTNQRSRYARFLGKFTPSDIDKMIEKATEDSRYLPRISQLNDAAKDLLVLQPDRKLKADPGCSICSGTGWEYVTINSAKTKNQDVRAVQPCHCRQTPHISDSEEIPF